MRLFGLSILFILVSCTGEQTGPIEITLDREQCERCQMVISDKNFVAQVRGGPKNKAFVFDDIGCAVIWLNNQPWGDKAKIWVANYKTGALLDAEIAYYVPEQITPMDFGFGAVPKPVAGSISFTELKPKLFMKKNMHGLH